jgi:diadenylate cyclase
MPQILPIAVPKLTLVHVVDILAVAILVYNFFLMARGRRAAHVLGGLGVLLAAYLIAVWARLEAFRSVIEFLAPYTVFALIVMFQAEIRRLLARFGRIPWRGLGGRLEQREVMEEITLAVRQIVETRSAGALIVVERDVGLRTFVESGVVLDARVSRDLLCTIFQRGGTLHDGAAIIQGDRIAAAACFLPLTTRPLMIRSVGTRHRAAIGVTEDTDALAVVVSEETWRISIAAHGELERDVNLDGLLERLTLHTAVRAARTASAPEPEQVES